ncbi:MAG: N-6 DNA methylase [Planctomycetes bacterium]|nr:N-6 DNA methylase [Planctomycetota bacterium]
MPNVSAREKDRLAEQVRLDALKTALERNKLGQFATPPALALDIATYAKRLLKGNRSAIRFLDPAIGTGSFYAAALETFSAKITTAAGIEIDSAFASAANEIWGPTGLKVSTGDFTKEPEPFVRFNLILTNPPYVRHHHLHAHDKPRLRDLVAERLGIQISGLAGLYCYFLLLAHSWLEKDGLAVWLIPSEFMDVNYGTAVKQYLTDKVTLLHIHRFCPSDVQFDDALVSSAVVVFKKSSATDNHTVEFSFGGTLNEPAKSQHVPLTELRERAKWTAYPNSGEVEKPAEGPRLGELFTIKRGLATGDNSFFILPREEANRLGIPSECLKPILPSPRYITNEMIEGGKDGYPKTDVVLSLIDTKLPESEIEKHFPEFWKYLQSGKAKSIHSRYLTSRRTPWYSQENREPAPFLCTYMGRSSGIGKKPFRFIWNQSKATAANVYLVLYPKGELKLALDADHSLYARVFDALNEISESAFKSEGRVYGGGLHKVEPLELSRLPVPKLAAAAGLPTRKKQRVAFA